MFKRYVIMEQYINFTLIELILTEFIYFDQKRRQKKKEPKIHDSDSVNKVSRISKRKKGDPASDVQEVCYTCTIHSFHINLTQLILIEFIYFVQKRKKKKKKKKETDRMEGAVKEPITITINDFAISFPQVSSFVEALNEFGLEKYYLWTSASSQWTSASSLRTSASPHLP